VEKFPHITFRSKKVDAVGKNRYRVVGDLTIRGITHEVALDTEFLGRMKDPFGDERITFSATTSIDRKDFGLAWNKPTERGGLRVGERVDIHLDVQGVKLAHQEQVS
jgi:polyisoprenoid-binding protein YceI